MRYQDRLLALLPAKHPHVSRYVARELEGQVPYFDSHRVVEALDAMAGSGDPGVAMQGALSLARFRPGHLARRYLPTDDPVGSRLQRTHDGTASSGRVAAVDRGEALDRLARAATHAMEPVVTRLTDLSARLHPKLRQRVVRTLAQIPHGAAADLARRLAAKLGTEGGPAPLYAAANLCRPGKEGELLRIVSHLDGTWLFGPAIAALALAPFEATFAFLGRQARAAPAEILPFVAAALEGFGPFAPAPLLATVVKRGTGWTVLAVLQTCGRLRDPALIPLIETIYSAHEHPSVREAAVRAAGSIRGAGAVALLRRVLSEQPAASVAARALQALQDIGDDPAELARLAAPFLRSEDPEASVSALLASLMGNEDAATESLKAMILSPSAHLRGEAAYCLAYYQGRASLEILAYLAARDPDAAVRRQAVGSFGAYESTAQVRTLLMGVLAGGDPKLAAIAAPLLMRPEAAADEAAASALVAACERAASPADARPLLGALGLSAAESASAHLAARLAESREPEELLGVLEGLDAGGRTVDPERLRTLMATGGAAIRAAAARLLWGQGDLAALDIAGALAADGSDAAAVTAAMAALDDMTGVGLGLAGEPRFEALERALRSRQESAACRDFSASELSLSPLRPSAALAHDPDASLIGRTPWHERDDAMLAEVTGQREAQDRPQARRSGRHRTPWEPAFDVSGLDGALPAFRGLTLASWVAVAVAVLALIGIFATVLRQSALALKTSGERPTPARADREAPGP